MFFVSYFSTDKLFLSPTGARRSYERIKRRGFKEIKRLFFIFTFCLDLGWTLEPSPGKKRQKKKKYFDWYSFLVLSAMQEKHDIRVRDPKKKLRWVIISKLLILFF